MPLGMMLSVVLVGSLSWATGVLAYAAKLWFENGQIPPGNIAPIAAWSGIGLLGAVPFVYLPVFFAVGTVVRSDTKRSSVVRVAAQATACAGAGLIPSALIGRAFGNGDLPSLTLSPFTAIFAIQGATFALGLFMAIRLLRGRGSQ